MSRKRSIEPDTYPLDYILPYLPRGTEHERCPGVFFYNGMNDLVKIYHLPYGDVYLQVDAFADTTHYQIRLNAYGGFRVHLDEFGRFWDASHTTAYPFHIQGHDLVYLTPNKADFDNLLKELLMVAEISAPNLHARPKHLHY